MTRPVPGPASITGLVLAGGRGRRMGGLDKGLQVWRGRALVDHVIDRLKPQVGALMINANRHHADYARRGVPVLPDARPDFSGPLAGILAGLKAAPTGWIAVVPCDAPRLPLDLVARLAGGLAVADAVPDTPETPETPESPGAVVRLRVAADTALADQDAWQVEPVFCLLATALAPSLERFLASHGRQVRRWMAAEGVREVPFDRDDDPLAFDNLNQPSDLLR